MVIILNSKLHTLVNFFPLEFLVSSPFSPVFNMKKVVSRCQSVNLSYKWITSKSSGRHILCLILLPVAPAIANDFHGLSNVSPPLFSKLTTELLKVDVFRSQRGLQWGKNWEHVWHLTCSETHISACSALPHHIAYSSISSTFFLLSFIIFIICLPHQLDNKLLGGKRNPYSFFPLYHIYI